MALLAAWVASVATEVSDGVTGVASETSVDSSWGGVNGSASYGCQSVSGVGGSQLF